MRLIGLEVTDENDNQYPGIYTRAIDAHSSELFHLQVNSFFASSRARGVEMASYLNKCLYDPLRLSQWSTANIMKQVLICKRLSGHQENIVFVWDIDDLTMLSKNHFDELELLRPDINSIELYNLRERICEGVNSLEDSMNIITKVDNIEDALSGETDEMRRAAPMYDALRKLYNNDDNSIQSKWSKGNKPILHLLEKCGMINQEVELCEIAKKHQQVFNNRWKYAKRCLELVNKRSSKAEKKNYTNVVLCKEGIASGFAQLLTANLSSAVEIENVYSTLHEPGKNYHHKMQPTIERLQHRFGNNCVFIHVSSGPFHVQLPMAMWSIRANESFKWLYNFQRNFL